MQPEYAAPYYRAPFFYGPGGKLIQVDAAMEAVGRGSTSVGLKTKDFVLLSGQVKAIRPLVDSYEKIYTIDEHLGATGSGYIGDVLRLVDQIRLEAQRHRVTYDAPIDVGLLAQDLASYLHTFTLYHIRLPGASVILAGADDKGLRLIQVDPGGTFLSGSAFAVGMNAETALEHIQKGYDGAMSLDAAINLSEKAIELAAQEKPAVEHGVVKLDKRVFERLGVNGTPH